MILLLTKRLGIVSSSIVSSIFHHQNSCVIPSHHIFRKTRWAVHFVNTNFHVPTTQKARSSSFWPQQWIFEQLINTVLSCSMITWALYKYFYGPVFGPVLRPKFNNIYITLLIWKQKKYKLFKCYYIKPKKVLKLTKTDLI